jgi:hypothetical protein
VSCEQRHGEATAARFGSRLAVVNARFGTGFPPNLGLPSVARRIPS